MVEIRRNKLPEIETKKAIDRASGVLDQLEQRIAQEDAQIRLVCDQYLKRLDEIGVFAAAG